MNYDDISWAEARKKMTNCAVAALKAGGYQVERIPERGRSSNWNYIHDETKGKLCIRTSNDRWFAFMNENGGWKTLDDMDKVVVVAVNDRDNPTHFQTYLFPADEVRKNFNKSRSARIEKGMTVREGYGMWIGLNESLEEGPVYVGSGLAEKYPAIATDLIFEEKDEHENENMTLETSNLSLDSVPDIIENAKSLISKKMGISKDQISLDLKFDF